MYCTDCEGPISKNDNAFESSQKFIPDGDIFFAKVSKYDDLLADIVKKEGYKAGDTLKLIPPFLMAYGVTNKKMEAFSAANLLLLPGAESTLRWIRQQEIPVYIVSTSYRFYIEALCRAIKFPIGNTYSTWLNFKAYRQSWGERRQLKKLAKEITDLPLLDWLPEASSLDDLSPEMRKVVLRLDQIFWEEIPQMASGQILIDVNPIGGIEKARAVEKAAKSEGVELSDVMYTGDSITDGDALRLVREAGGVAVSFNGNAYAIREAEIAVLSPHTIIVELLAYVFSKQGKDGVLRLAQDWKTNPLRGFDIPQDLARRLGSVFHGWLADRQMYFITDKNRERLIKESSAFRKTVRGEKVGALG